MYLSLQNLFPQPYFAALSNTTSKQKLSLVTTCVCCGLYVPSQALVWNVCLLHFSRYSSQPLPTSFCLPSLSFDPLLSDSFLYHTFHSEMIPQCLIFLKHIFILPTLNLSILHYLEDLEHLGSSSSFSTDKNDLFIFEVGLVIATHLPLLEYGRDQVWKWYFKESTCTTVRGFLLYFVLCKVAVLKKARSTPYYVLSLCILNGLKSGALHITGAQEMSLEWMMNHLCRKECEPSSHCPHRVCLLTTGDSGIILNVRSCFKLFPSNPPATPIFKTAYSLVSRCCLCALQVNIWTIIPAIHFTLMLVLGGPWTLCPHRRPRKCYQVAIFSWLWWRWTKAINYSPLLWGENDHDRNWI